MGDALCKSCPKIAKIQTSESVFNQNLRPSKFLICSSGSRIFRFMTRFPNLGIVDGRSL